MKIELNSNQISLINLALRIAMTIWSENEKTAKEGNCAGLAKLFRNQIDDSEEIFEHLFKDEDDNTETTLNEAQIQNLKAVLKDWEAHMINPELVIRCIIRAVEKED